MAWRQVFMKNWYSPEVIPIYVITALAGGGATWYLARLASGPDIIWDRKNNATPWMSVEQGTTTKMLDPSGHFEKKYRRDKI
ncbi:hypothetical protein OC846_000641 [Tilletia horrida]|uniref:NADH dehydrogenase [ubiquinone] 1 alpha subcomplex subunit 4 n=1 Tax=Tilletia horrida TaxID=155126 RepID=A0AAN6JWT2_9BASI|nr:hypothetical protein OC845_000773 [Tilletia horrida]KAK0557191.1 hypothetical protein OC846_000641 [Tilletia horrida]KAK0569781.1 hypothetical protein OC861_000618 [Tilletia horrida]